MSKKNKYLGKIGYCTNKTLGIGNCSDDDGHYVYIRKYANGKCYVNTITSLTRADGKFDFDRLNKVRNGYLYPIPQNHANFKRWSAINLSRNIMPVDASKVVDIGKKRIKDRHKFFVGKFSSK